MNIKNEIFSTVDLDSFLSKYWNKHYFKMNQTENDLLNSFSIADFKNLLTTQKDQIKFEVFCKSRFKLNTSKLNLREILELGKYTFRIDEISSKNKRLFLMQGLFSNLFNLKTSMNAYYTPKNQQGLLPHEKNHLFQSLLNLT